jgi:hypothetical protein
MKSNIRLHIWLGVSLLLICVGMGAAAEKRHTDTHVHGVAEINIAVEGAKAVIEFRAPAESVMGFEHEAKSDSDRKKRDAALELLRAKKDQLVLFDSKLGCKPSEMKTKVVEEQRADAKEQRGRDGHGHQDQRRAANTAKSTELSPSRAINLLRAVELDSVWGRFFPISMR